MVALAISVAHTPGVSHLAILYYVVVALVGFMALTVSILGTIRSRIGSYWLLVAFYGLLSVRIGIVAVEQYMVVAFDPIPTSALERTATIGGALTALFMCSITLYLHTVVLSRKRVIADAVVVGVSLFVLVVTALPGLRVSRVAGDIVGFTLLGSIAYIISLALFVYVLVICAGGSRRGRAIREVVLIWSLFGFGLVAFTQDFFGMISYFAGARPLAIGTTSPSFLAASVPHLVFGGVLVYYFGSYVLSERQATPAKLDSIIERYGISPREAEVIPLLNRGLSNREIAERLFVSLATIKTHVHRIYEKTGAKSRYELFRLTRD